MARLDTHRTYRHSPKMAASIATLAAEFRDGTTPFHKGPVRLEEINSQNGNHRIGRNLLEHQGLMAGHVAKALRDGMKQRYSIRTPALDQQSLAMPVEVGPDGKVKVIVPQYFGGTSSIVGPVTVDVIRLTGQGPEQLVFEAPILLSPCRQGVVEGVSAGLNRFLKLRDFGESGNVTVAMSAGSNATRSPTMFFESVSMAEQAVQLLSSPDFIKAVKETGTKSMQRFNGELGNVTFKWLPAGGGAELSINFIYPMYGDYFGHEAATAITSNLMKTMLRPRLDGQGIEYTTLWLAGGEDGDLKPSSKNVRGRDVFASIFIPEDALPRLMGEGMTAKTFIQLNTSKYHTWPTWQGANSFTGMENEILAAALAPIESASPPFVSSHSRVTATAVDSPRSGVSYQLHIPNFEWGVEGLRMPISVDSGRVMGLDTDNPDPQGQNSMRVAALISTAMLAGGFNQHVLAFNDRVGKGGLGETKRV